MATVIIPLAQFVVEPDSLIDLTTLSEDQAIDLVKQSFSFLQTAITVDIRDGNVVISINDKKKAQVEKALTLFERAVRHAQKGNNQSATSLFNRVLEVLPLHVDSRRNLAMVHYERGDAERAKSLALEVVKLEPKNAWNWLLLANTYNRFDQNVVLAERLYQRAYAMDPDDIHVLSSYGSLMAKCGSPSQAQSLFEKAIRVDPSYPNPYYGLALLHLDSDQLQDALAALERLFSQTPSDDVRTVPLYQEARRLYLEAAQRMATASYDTWLQIAEGMKSEIERQSGFPIESVEDNNLDTLGVAQMAWRHGTRGHTIRYRGDNRAIVPHLLVHEMEHIRLEAEARESHAARDVFITGRNREVALRSIGTHAFKLQKKGIPEAAIKQYLSKLIDGVCNRVYSCPLDMVIERRIYHNLPQLRPSQVLSLTVSQQMALPELTDRSITELTPPLIYKAGVALNVLYYLFIDNLFEGKTALVVPYRGSQVFPTAQKLYAIWQQTADSLKPGDEYALVDQFARILGLADWFDWRSQETSALGMSEPKTSSGERNKSVTNPELLEAKSPASIMYCLGALQRFASMPRTEVFRVASEIALLGRSGLDYSSSDQQYTLKSLPEERFTGLQLLCMMYVGFKEVEPDLDLEIDLAEPYRIAQGLFDPKGR